jgi:hypothetical protein
VEQVTTFVLAGAWQDSGSIGMKRGDRGSGIFNLAIILFAGVSLQKQQKQQGATDPGVGEAVA